MPVEMDLRRIRGTFNLASYKRRTGAFVFNPVLLQKFRRFDLTMPDTTNIKGARPNGGSAATRKQRPLRNQMRRQDAGATT
jgi:hypothetical protein